jgi:hypothetical protein
MKLNSPLYDRIRLKPDEDRRLKESCPACDWAGCKEPATHRAPKGRGREGEYWSYCLPHVREYNQSYNYFKDMKDDAVEAYLRDSLTGHRPTWKMGQHGGQKSAAFGGNPKFSAGQSWFDPFQVFEGASGTYRPDREAPEGRMIRNAERKALDTMGLDTDATAAEIKARFKELVKRHHPDANGGDRSTEDRLRSVIQAYNYLKSAGFC